MSNLAICRVCLACNTKMHHIANTPYQEILEKLATKLYTADGRPNTVCWVCLSALRCGQWVADTTRAAHEILTQLSLNGVQLSEDTVSMHDRKFLCKLAWTPIQTLSIGKEFLHSPFKVEIKEDPSENEEITGFISKDEQINCTLSGYKSFTVKNEEIFCDNITIRENEDDKDEQTNCILSEDESFTVKTEENFCDNITICENYDDKDEQINCTLCKEESLTVKTEENFCDNITIGENEEHTGKVSKNDEHTGKVSKDDEHTGKVSKDDENTGKVNKNDKHTGKVSKNDEHTGKLSKKGQPTGKVSKNDEHTSNISENEQSTRDIGNYQCTENRSVNVLINKVGKTHAEKRSKSKRSSEVIVKDQKGQDCVRHICPTCDKMYKQRCHLLRHLKTHSKTASQSSGHPPHSPPKNLICELCGKGFGNNYTLKKHLLVHQGVRNFACAHCPIKVVQKSDLIRHLRIHTGQKPYKCDICDKEYSQKAILVRHMIIHTGGTPYSCERCSLKFNRHSSMVRHVKRRHYSSDKRCYKGQRLPQL